MSLHAKLVGRWSPIHLFISFAFLSWMPTQNADGPIQLAFEDIFSFIHSPFRIYPSPYYGIEKIKFLSSILIHILIKKLFYFLNSIIIQTIRRGFNINLSSGQLGAIYNNSSRAEPILMILVIN
jgi:hypothetical protein